MILSSTVPNQLSSENREQGAGGNRYRDACRLRSRALACPRPETACGDARPATSATASPTPMTTGTLPPTPRLVWRGNLARTAGPGMTTILSRRKSGRSVRSPRQARTRRASQLNSVAAVPGRGQVTGPSRMQKRVPWVRRCVRPRSTRLRERSCARRRILGRSCRTIGHA